MSEDAEGYPRKAFGTVSQNCLVTQLVSDSWRCGQQGRELTGLPGSTVLESPADNPYTGVSIKDHYGALTLGIAHINVGYERTKGTPSRILVVKKLRGNSRYVGDRAAILREWDRLRTWLDREPLKFIEALLIKDTYTLE